MSITLLLLGSILQCVLAIEVVGAPPPPVPTVTVNPSWEVSWSCSMDQKVTGIAPQLDGSFFVMYTGISAGPELVQVLANGLQGHIWKLSKNGLGNCDKLVGGWVNPSTQMGYFAFSAQSSGGPSQVLVLDVSPSPTVPAQSSLMEGAAPLSGTLVNNPNRPVVLLVVAVYTEATASLWELDLRTGLLDKRVPTPFLSQVGNGPVVSCNPTNTVVYLGGAVYNQSIQFPWSVFFYQLDPATLQPIPGAPFFQELGSAVTYLVSHGGAVSRAVIGVQSTNKFGCLFTQYVTDGNFTIYGLTQTSNTIEKVFRYSYWILSLLPSQNWAVSMDSTSWYKPMNYATISNVGSSGLQQNRAVQAGNTLVIPAVDCIDGQLSVFVYALSDFN